MAADPSPIFVGGSGRSGTTVVARLLAQHSTLVLVPRELRIHVQRRGLLDVVEGRSSVAHLLTMLRGRAYRRTVDPAGQNPTEIGLYELIDEDRLEDLIAALQARFKTNPDDAGRIFIRGILDPVATSCGATGWVEHSPENLIYTSTLARIFPDLRFVHALRDGRDVAASIVEKPWGPDTFEEALRWWGHRLRTGHEQLRTLDPASVHTVFLEDLVGSDREASVQALFAFVGLSTDAEEEVHLFTAGRLPSAKGPTGLSSQRAKVGRWRHDIPEERWIETEHTYAGILESLDRSGVTLPRSTDPPPPLDDHLLEVQVRAQEEYEVAATTAVVEANSDKSPLIQRAR